ncbi:hypothetical protein Btru_045160 [Bulinus truncatus]|nr:hypothetical protein Btru_045160 [Bulinus truncatus]
MSLLNCARSTNENKSSKIRPENKSKEVKNSKSSSKQSGNKATNEMGTQSVIQYLPDILHYELFAVIGKGHSGTSTISLAKHIPSDSLVAIKKINIEVWDKELSYIQNEIILTQLLSHQNLLPLHCSFVTGQELWTVMPLMAFGSCRDLIHAYFNSGLPEQAIIFILRDVLLAVEYVHQRGVIHRGIKSSHVLISKNGLVCLSGLHNACSTLQYGKKLRKVHDFPIHSIDCLHSFSPELLQQNLAGYNFKSDIYSIGILACELANGQSPFSDMPATQMLLEKLNGTKPKLADSTTVGDFVIDDDDPEDQSGTTQERADAIFFKRTFSANLHDFTSQCLEFDISKRPSATQLLNHPVFKTIKNRPSSSLPSLLQPVTPLTDVAKVPRELTAEDDEFSRKMSEVSIPISKPFGAGFWCPNYCDHLRWGGSGYGNMMQEGRGKRLTEIRPTTRAGMIGMQGSRLKRGSPNSIKSCINMSLFKNNLVNNCWGFSQKLSCPVVIQSYLASPAYKSMSHTNISLYLLLNVIW